MPLPPPDPCQDERASSLRRFRPGQRVTARVRRCVADTMAEQWPPRCAVEHRRGVIVSIGPSGMLHIQCDGGGWACAFADEIV